MRCARRSVTAARGSSPAGPGSTSITSSPPQLPVTSRMRSICWRRRAAGCCPTIVSTRAPACGAMLAAPRGGRCGCLKCPTAQTGKWPTRAAARRQVKTPSRAICGRPARCWTYVRPPSATGRQGWAPTSRPCAGSRFPRHASGYSQRITRLMRQLTWRRGHVRRGNSGSTSNLLFSIPREGIVMKFLISFRCCAAGATRCRWPSPPPPGQFGHRLARVECQAGEFQLQGGQAAGQRADVRPAALPQ